VLFRRKKAGVVRGRGGADEGRSLAGEDVLGDLDDIERARHDLVVARLEVLGKAGGGRSAGCGEVAGRSDGGCEVAADEASPAGEGEAAVVEGAGEVSSGDGARCVSSPSQPKRYNRHIRQILHDDDKVSVLMRVLVSGDIRAHRLAQRSDK